MATIPQQLSIISDLQEWYAWPTMSGYVRREEGLWQLIDLFGIVSYSRPQPYNDYWDVEI